MTGKVFDIRRFSTHDGDGIRTTVFLKGCPLKCVWCQNPEGISIRKRPIYFENRCMHCKMCIAKSKNQGVTMENDQIHIHPNRNENWNTIIDWCPTGAIAMDSREMSVEMVMEEIRKDKSFYRYGNGGVTIAVWIPSFLHAFNSSFVNFHCNNGSPPEIVTPPFP